MTEAIETISTLSPIAAVVIIAGVAAMALTQAAKQPTMTKARTQALAVGISAVLGTLAYIVSGVATVFPDTVVQAVSTGVVVVAAVAITSRVAYGMVGRAIPDGTEHPPALTVRFTETPPDGPAETVVPARGRRAAREPGDAGT